MMKAPSKKRFVQKPKKINLAKNSIFFSSNFIQNLLDGNVNYFLTDLHKCNYRKKNCLSPLKKTYLKPKEMYPVQKFYIFIKFCQKPVG